MTASTVTTDTAPRNMEGLTKLTRPVRYRLALGMGILHHETDSEQGFLVATDEEQCRTLLTALLHRDGADGAPSQSMFQQPQQEQTPMTQPPQAYQPPPPSVTPQPLAQPGGPPPVYGQPPQGPPAAYPQAQPQAPYTPPPPTGLPPQAPPGYPPTQPPPGYPPQQPGYPQAQPLSGYPVATQPPPGYPPQTPPGYPQQQPAYPPQQAPVAGAYPQPGTYPQPGQPQPWSPPAQPPPPAAAYPHPQPPPQLVSYPPPPTQAQQPAPTNGSTGRAPSTMGDPNNAGQTINVPAKLAELHTTILGMGRTQNMLTILVLEMAARVIGIDKASLVSLAIKNSLAGEPERLFEQSVQQGKAQ